MYRYWSCGSMARLWLWPAQPSNIAADEDEAHFRARLSRHLPLAMTQRRSGWRGRRWAGRQSCSSRRRSGPCRGVRRRRPLRPGVSDAGAGFAVDEDHVGDAGHGSGAFQRWRRTQVRSRQEAITLTRRPIISVNGGALVGAVVQHQHMAVVTRHHGGHRGFHAEGAAACRAFTTWLSPVHDLQQAAAHGGHGVEARVP